MKRIMLMSAAWIGLLFGIAGMCLAEELPESNTLTVQNVELQEEYQEELYVYLPEVDFEELHGWNPDIYAWIYIPDTVINYPILRSGAELEEDYYLDHTVNHEEGYPGSIFTERYNADDFTDVNTVIYGHNMRDGSMFGSLASYKNTDFMMTHPMIYICTEEGWLTYQVTCGVVSDDQHILFRYGFVRDNYPAFDLFLDDLYYDTEYEEENAYLLKREEYDPLRDTLITLSTCVNGNRPENRFFLVGRLVDGPETALSRIKSKRVDLVIKYIEEE